MLFLGVDPGCRGAIAAVDHTGQITSVQKFAVPTKEIIAWFQGMDRTLIKFAVLERVSSSQQMGVVSAFTFGRMYGLAETLLDSFFVPFERVSPLTWQRVMGCRSKGDKNVTKARAYELWPNMKFTHQTADACLLALYCLRTYNRYLC